MSSLSEKRSKKVRILLVEDDPIVQKVHRSKLEKLGYSVDSATTGREALELYHNGYSIILLDYGLPDINGIEVAKKIRHYEQLNRVAEQVPMIMITAYVNDVKLQRECMQAGINEVINKPIIDDEAMQAILLRWFL